MTVRRFKGSCVRSLAGEGYGTRSQAPLAARPALPSAHQAWMFQACSPSLSSEIGDASPQARVAPSFRSVITTKMAGDASAPSRFRFAEQKAKAQVEAGRRDSAKGRKGSILGKVIRSASFDSAQKRVRPSRAPPARDPRHPDPPPDAFAPRAIDARADRRSTFDASDAPPSAGGGVAARSRELEALHQHGTPPASRPVPARRASRAPGFPRRSSLRFGGRRSSRRSARSERDRLPPAPRHSRRGERRAEQCRHPRAHCRV